MGITDISPSGRALLARLRFRPELFLGEKSLRNFCHMSIGYSYAMQNAGLGERHNLLPEGLDAFTAAYLHTDAGSRSCFSMIAAAEPDDGKALELFFVILDAYLDEKGLEPLARVNGWDAFHALRPDGRKE